MKVKIRGKVHDPAMFDALTIRQTIQLNGQLRELGADLTFDDLKDILEAQRTGDRKMSDLEGLVLFGVMVWATRCADGEHVTLSEACDIRMSEVSWVNDDGTDLSDDQVAEMGNPGKAPAQSPAGSAAAGGNRAERRAKKTTSSK